MCPVCTVSVIAGLGISRVLGIDDIISSIWIGGLILSLSFVTTNWIAKKWPKLPTASYKPTVFVIMYLLVLIPLKSKGIIGISGNTFWGIDKILLGITVGSIVFLVSVWKDKWVRKILKRQLFPFQKVIFPVLGLIIASIIFYFLART